MPDEPLSRRGLLSLTWARGAAPAPPDLADRTAAQRERWAGAAPLLAALAPLAGVLCDVAAAGPSRRLLDVNAGAGAVSAEAAGRGAVVTACDPVPALVEAGRERTAADGVDVAWALADPEALPFADAAFDAVVSLYGAAFAPHAGRTARELLRVLVPGGLLALAAPAPRSFLAGALGLARPRPEGVRSPAAWGREDVALARLEAAAPGTEIETRELPFSLEFASERDAWTACAGPLGLPAGSRDAFANLVSTRSDAVRVVRIAERATLILARREL